jgi:hypothetical protein
MMLASIKTEGLLELLWVAPAATIAVSFAYSLCIVGVARSNDARRSGDAATATAWGALAVVSVVAFAAIVVIGVLVITHKD